MHKNLKILLGINLATLVAMFCLDPITQNNAYHNFADKRAFLGVRNFFDCFSNLAFLYVSYLGIKYSAKNFLSISWKFFFIAVALVGIGSFYYHYTPNSQTLIWDRLPMTLAFMSIVNAVFTETFSLSHERRNLVFLNLVGVLSIIVWVTTGDLRFYFWVQLTPILSLLLIGLFFSKELNAKYLIGAFLFYMFAKATEHNDKEIYDVLGLSGHTIKHLLAAVSIYLLFVMKKKPKV